MTHEEKVKLYREQAYSFKVPPVPTQYWTEAAWIAWIDSNGTWHRGETTIKRVAAPS